MLPGAELRAFEEGGAEVAGAAARAGRVGEVVVGQSLDRVPRHAGLLLEVLDGGLHRREQLVLEHRIGEAARDELEIRAPGFVRVVDAERLHLVVVRDEDLAAAVGADAAEFRRLVEDYRAQTEVVRRDRRRNRAESGTHGDEVDFQVPLRRQIRRQARWARRDPSWWISKRRVS